MLIVQHGLQSLAANVAQSATINRIADFHVVGRDALGDRARAAAHSKKPADYLLSRTDLGKGSVTPLVQIDVEGFLVRIDDLAVMTAIGHSYHAWAVSIWKGVL